MSWGMLELRRESDDTRRYIYSRLSAAIDDLDDAYKAEENAQRRNYISSIIHDIKAGMKDYEEN